MLKINKNQLLIALMRTSVIKEQDYIHRLEVFSHHIEIGFEIVELSTGLTASHILKIHESDIMPWEVDKIITPLSGLIELNGDDIKLKDAT